MIHSWGQGGLESKHLPPTQQGGTSSKPTSLISRDFPTNFSCSIFFFLLASCFLFLRFDASPNSSCEIKLWSWEEKDKEVRRRKGIGDCSLFSFLLKSFPTETEFMETHNCLCKMWSWKAPSGGIFHSRPVHTVVRVKKNNVVEHSMYNQKGYTCHAELSQTEDGVLVFYLLYLHLLLPYKDTS